VDNVINLFRLLGNRKIISFNDNYKIYHILYIMLYILYICYFVYIKFYINLLAPELFFLNFSTLCI